MELHTNRVSVLGYGLLINDIRSDDEGTYICQLDNGENPVKIHTIKFNVLHMPHIVEAPKTTLTNESDRLELHCRASGSPPPEINWMINGENTRFDPLITSQGSRLVIRSVEKKHAGIVQCFARNEVGEVNEGALLQVNPKQIDGEGKQIPLGIPQKSRSRNSNRAPNERRKSKGRKCYDIHEFFLETIYFKQIIQLQEFFESGEKADQGHEETFLFLVVLFQFHSKSNDSCP